MPLIPDLPASSTVAATDVFIKDTGSVSEKITAPDLANALLEQTNSTTTSTVASIITAASGYTISAATLATAGKVAMLYLEFTSNTAISVDAAGDTTNFQIGTLVSGKRPAAYGAFSSAGDNVAADGYIAPNGRVYVTGFKGTGSARTIAANTTLYVYAMYVMA